MKLELFDTLPEEILFLIFSNSSIVDIYGFHYAITNHEYRFQWNQLFRRLIHPKYQLSVSTTIPVVFSTPIYVIEETRIVIVSPGQEFLTVWNLVDGSVRELKGHDSRIHTFLKVDDIRVISSSNNCTKVWNCINGQCESTLNHPEHPVLGMILLKDRERIATHSRDETISIWNIKSGSCEKIFPVFSAAIRSILQLTNNHLAVCLFNQPLQLLNLETTNCIQTFELPTTKKKMLEIFPNILLLWKSPGSISILHLETKNFEVLDNRQITQLLLLSPQNQHPKYQVVAADNLGMMKTWDIHRKLCYKTFHHGGKNMIRAPVNYLYELPNGRVLSGGSRGMMKIWNLERGECERILQDVTMGCFHELGNGRFIVGVIHKKDNYLEIWDPVDSK